MTPVIEISNSKELPNLWIIGTDWYPEDYLPVYQRKYGHEPSVCWKLGALYWYPIHQVCPVCFQVVEQIGACERCGDGG